MVRMQTISPIKKFVLPDSKVSPSSVSSSSAIPVEPTGELERDAFLELPPLRLVLLTSDCGAIGTSMFPLSSSRSTTSLVPSSGFFVVAETNPPLEEVRVSLLDALQ